MTTPAAQARAERQQIEDELAEAASRALARFLVAVESEAVQALPLTAAAAARGFSFDRVRSVWQRIVEPLKTILPDSVAHDAYDYARSVLTSKNPTRAALAKALSFEDAEHWQAVVARSARTAATRQHAQRQVERFRQAGHPGKTWDADLDSATRPTHRAADGQTVALDAGFTVGGWTMLYPGDQAAPPDETENCRCVLVGAAAPALAASLGPEGTEMLIAIRERSPGFPLGLAVLMAAAWDELAHPRGKDGKFIHKTGMHRAVEEVRNRYAEKIASGEITHPDQLKGLSQDVIDSAYKKAGVPKPGGSQTGEQVGAPALPPSKTDLIKKAGQERAALGWNGSKSTPEQKAANSRLNVLLDEAQASLKQANAEGDDQKAHEAREMLHAGRPDLYKDPGPAPAAKAAGPNDSAEDVARKMARGEGISDSALGSKVEQSIDQWMAHPDDLKDKSVLESAAAAALPSTRLLYRGISASEKANPQAMSLIRQLKAAKPGDTIQTDRLASWSEKEHVGRQFAGDGSNEVEGVMFVAQPGIKALPISQYAQDPNAAQFADEAEHIAPPSDYTVVSVSPSLSVPGLTVVTVKAAR